jgi:hypothetical protein
MIRVTAAWDPDAKVWYIANSDLPGLHLEGATPQHLYDQLPGAIADLLEGTGAKEVPFELVTPGHVNIAA